MKAFEELGICEPILKSIKEQGFEEPTEIQRKAIPESLDGKDILGWSATGSGKTLAFGTVLVQRAEPGKGIQGLILAPTRELALQVAKELELFSKYKNLKIATVYGGVAIGPQMDDLEVCDIVVGTPGRVLDHVGRGTIDLSKVQVLILDEADKMFDMGFIEDVQEIIRETPVERQTLMFSATTSKKVVHMAHDYMHQPIEITVESHVDPSLLKQIYYDVPDNQKFSLLVHLLKNEEAGLVMVFCNSRNNTDFVASNLKHQGIDAMGIHGGLSQEKREKIIKKFHAQHAFVLVCTDVAARGLHIDNVSHVYNYDAPKEPKQYVHRIGRTARAGAEGIAINLLSYRDYENMDRVFRENRGLVVDKAELPQFPRVRIVKNDYPRKGDGAGRFGDRRGGGRFSKGPQQRRSRQGSRHHHSMRPRE